MLGMEIFMKDFTESGALVCSMSLFSNETVVLLLLFSTLLMLSLKLDSEAKAFLPSLGSLTYFLSNERKELFLVLVGYFAGY
jgi:hypothetical protein